MTTRPPHIAFIWTGEEREPKPGEWYSGLDGQCYRLTPGLCCPDRRHIYRPITTEAEYRAVQFPKEQTEGERWAMEWRDHRSGPDLAAFIDRKLAERGGK